MSKKRNLGQKARREVSLMKSFAKVMPRDDLAPILEAASSDKRVETMYNMFYDPAFSNMSLATMARTCGITYTELCDIIKKHRIAEAHVQAANHLPQVMEDIAEDAKNKKEFCPKCSGVGSIFDPLNKTEDGAGIPIGCPQCSGTGEIKKSGDAGARKLILESLGVIGGRGPLIAVQNNNMTVGEDDMESILKGAKPRPQLPEKGGTLEAEIVKGDES